MPTGRDPPPGCGRCCGACRFAIGGGLGFLAHPWRHEHAGAYLAFLSAMALWGWVELAFLAGIITGPNGHALPPATPEWERFIRAWGTIAYHELLLVFVLVAMIVAARGAENLFGLLTFGILFVARISAKLNLYLGVSKINTEFLPGHLTHLESHFRSARMNWLFPLSITVLSIATACWVERHGACHSSADASGVCAPCRADRAGLT